MALAPKGGSVEQRIDYPIFEPNPGPFGAIVSGLESLTSVTEPAVADAILQAIGQHLVLIFRGHRQPTDDEFVLFAKQFGEFCESELVLERTRPGNPDISVVSNIVENGHAVGSGNGANELGWHTDLAWDERLVRFGYLEALELPESGGGQTLFASGYHAFEALSVDEQRYLETLRATFAAPRPELYRPGSEGRESSLAPTPHPLVVTNPDSSRRALFLSPRTIVAIEGMSSDESAELLEHLIADLTKPACVLEHEWRVGDLVMWDEIGLSHSRRSFNPSERRYMRQTMVKAG